VALMRAIDAGLGARPTHDPGRARAVDHGRASATRRRASARCRAAGIHLWQCDGVDAVVKAVRYQIKHGAKVIKICATAGVLSFEGPVGAQQYSLEELKRRPTRRTGTAPIAAHAHGTEGIIASSQAGIDSIEHDSIIDGRGRGDHQEKRQHSSRRTCT
jgi:imidazolonepropionase-like amidohydrolase